jgi:hypothetical protein
VLLDEAFIAKHLSPTTSERDIIYEDSELGFCIIAHHYLSPKSSDPHDHAHSWAIYGQARGSTEMRDYQKIEGLNFIQVCRRPVIQPKSKHCYDKARFIC